jgi:hypothetical protein
VDTPLEFLVGLAAAGSTIASLLPQLLEEDSRAILKEVYLLMIAGFALWVVHGVMIENAGDIVLSVPTMV